MSTKENNVIVFYVNGKRTKIANPSPSLTLLEYLRDVLMLRGTKRAESVMTSGCATVVMAHSGPQNKIEYRSIDSNVYPIIECDGKAFMTIEALGDSKNLHIIQQKWIDLFASQSGYDTPGFIMNLCALFLNNPKPTPVEVEKIYDGMLCRETGYRPILEASKILAKDHTPMKFPTTFDFPHELLGWKHESLRIQDDYTTAFRPVTIAEVDELKAKYTDAVMISGNTHIGKTIYASHSKPKFAIYISAVAEIHKIAVDAKSIVVGGGASFTEIISALKHAEHPLAVAISNILNGVAGPQVQSVATLGGLIASGVAYSEVIAMLIACSSTVLCSSKKSMTVDEYASGKHKDLIVSITIPLVANSYVVSNIGTRWEYMDSRVVLAVYLVTESGVIKSTKIVAGGICPDKDPLGYVVMSNVGNALTGKNLKEPSKIFDEVAESFIKEVPLNTSSAHGLVEYRRVCSLGMLLKNLTQLAGYFKVDVDASLATLLPQERETVTAIRDYEQSQYDELGKPIPQLKAHVLASGESVFVDDVNIPLNTLHGAFVLSPHAHAKVVGIDFSKALEIPGVHHVLTAIDIPGKNVVGTIWSDEYIFVPIGANAQHVGDTIACVLAESKAIAHYAVSLVKVDYEVLKPIITIDDAIASKSYFPFPAFGYSDTYPNPNPFRLGVEEEDIKAELAKCERVIEDVIELGSHEHYYMEPQSSYCAPGEGGSYHILSATQVVTANQQYAASCLGVDRNRVIVKVNRCGGAFGGKESRSTPICCVAALGTYVTKRPCKVILDREEDFQMTGGRHPMRFHYSVGFTKDGMLKALWVELWANCGYSYDFGAPVMSRALAKVSNAYRYPVVRAVGLMCKTHTRSNTAYRGFGDPQGMFCAEAIIERVAAECKKDANEIRVMNMMKLGEVTHYAQEIEEDRLMPMWKQLTRDYSERKLAIDQFNQKSKYVKRGIAAIPSLYGLSFSQKFLCQGSALIHVYTDGSIGLNIGGVELGQGLYTKMSLLCAQHMGVPVSKVHIEETASDKCANTVPTAASTGTDLCGGAVVHACDQILKEMNAQKADMMAAKPGYTPTFQEVAASCFMNRRNLSACGYYIIPDISFDWVTQKGRMFNYFTHGSSLAEVEVDILTGQTRMLFYRVVFDVGTSLNPGVDIGQIEGAGMQGIGLYVYERWSFDPVNGQPLQNSDQYCLPRPQDVPRGWDIELMKGVPNPRSAYSSKGIGEPPLGLGMSAFLAVKYAVAAYREQIGLSQYVKMDAPCTPYRVRMACADSMVKLASVDSKVTASDNMYERFL